MSRRQQYTQNGLVVPDITLWTAEESTRPPTMVRRIGSNGAFLGYRDELSYDRNTEGTLWARQAIAQGRGKAKFDSVNALRQRRAMSHLLCQVCGIHVLDAEHEHQLFLLHTASGQPVREGELTTAPPVCESCAPVAKELCPRLRAGHAAAWVERSWLWGVAGIRYDPKTLKPLPSKGLMEVAYGSPEIQWVVAYRQVVSLHGCTPVNVDDLVSSRQRAASAGR